MLQRVLLSTVVMLAIAGCSQQAPADPASVPATGQDAAPAAAAAIPVSLPTQFIAFGTEPFWSVSVDGDRLHWSSPENMDGIAFTAQPEQVGAQHRYAGQLDGEAVVLDIHAEPCSDGMSDALHPWTVSWQHAGKRLSGCARIP